MPSSNSRLDRPIPFHQRTKTLLHSKCRRGFRLFIFRPKGQPATGRLVRQGKKAA